MEGVFLEEVNSDLMKEFEQKQAHYVNGFVRLQPFNQIFPKCFIQFQKELNEFLVHDDDVWIASFPKCGKEHVNCICGEDGNKPRECLE